MKKGDKRDYNLDDYTKDIGERLLGAVVKTKAFVNINKFPLIEGKQCLYVMDWKQSKLSYTRGIFTMLGYTEEEFTMEKALSSIHPEDQSVVNRIIKGMVDHSIKTYVAGANQFLSLTYRLLKKDGTYLKVLRQSSPFHLDGEGQFISNLSFLTDISFMAKTNVVEWEIHSNDLDVDAYKKSIYHEFQSFFTAREMQIIECLANDLTNRQIAAQLYISMHTVVSHKKNILKKSNCHNTKELLSFSRTNGIIS